MIVEHASMPLSLAPPSIRALLLSLMSFASAVAISPGSARAQTCPNIESRYNLGSLGSSEVASFWLERDTGSLKRGLYLACTRSPWTRSSAAGVGHWDGSGWRLLPSPFSGTPTTLRVFDDPVAGPSLFIGGHFELSEPPYTRFTVARLDPAGWTPILLRSSVRDAPTPLDMESVDTPHLRGLYICINAQNQFTGVGTVLRWDGVQWTNLGFMDRAIPEAGSVDLEVHDDGSGPALYVHGPFNSIGSVAAAGIAKWDGTTWSPLGPALGVRDADQAASVRRVLHSSPADGNLYIAGAFSFTAGPDAGPANGLARWDGATLRAVPVLNDPRPITTVNSFLDPNAPRVVVSGGDQLYQTDGDLLMPAGAGARTEALLAATTPDGSPRLIRVRASDPVVGIADLNSSLADWDGRFWNPLSGGERSLPTVQIESSLPGDLGGSFGLSDLRPQLGLVRRVPGWGWSAITAGAPVLSASVVAHSDAQGPALFLAGAIASTHLPSRSGVARFDGRVWSDVGDGLAGRFPTTLVSFTPGGINWLVALGDQLQPAAASTPVSRWDGTTWADLPSIPGRLLRAETLSDSSGPRLIASTIDGPILRWSGSDWIQMGRATQAVDFVEFDAGAGPAIYAAARDSDAGFLLRWDGTDWTRVAPLTIGALGSADLTVFDDGRGPQIYLSTSTQSSPENRGLRRIRPDQPGAAWQPVSLGAPADTSRMTLVVSSDDGDSAPTLTASLLDPFGFIRIIRPCEPCAADLDNGRGGGVRDGAATLDDLLYFLPLFSAGDRRADLDDGSGTGTTDGAITTDDLLYFLDRYHSGC